MNKIYIIKWSISDIRESKDRNVRFKLRFRILCLSLIRSKKAKDYKVKQ